MRCVNPRRLPNPAATSVYDAYIVTSCGKCYACLSNRRRAWLFRLMHESLHSVISLFVTLTYDEFSVLKSSTDSQLYLCKSDLQKFFKRLRHHEQFTYYAIGEYGTTTHRPHYHVCIFFKTAPYTNTLDELTYLIHDLWSYGFVSVSRAHYRRLNYVLHYHVRPKVIDGRPTFQLYSKGLGMDFLTDDMIDYLCNSGKTTIKDYNGTTYVIPRYYRKKLSEAGYPIPSFTQNSVEKDTIVQQIEKVFDKKIWQIPSEQVSQYLHFRLNQSMKKIVNYNQQDKFV